MHLTFLQAAVPLSKTLTYSPRDGEYTVSAYPMVRRMTSYEAEVHDMFGFTEALAEHGAKGRCLMFGQLDRPLKDESRADHADKNVPHEWIVFDFDKVDAPPTMEGALEAIAKYLPDVCQSAECCIQLSPSCYMPRATKLSCHVFMRLGRAYTTQEIKDFLIWCNFSNEYLNSQIGLTESGNALTMRVDRCVADPSRLIYVAPPRTIGFKPNLDEVLGHFAGDPSFFLPAFTPITHAQQTEKINELRAAQHLDPRDFRTVKFRGVDVLQTVDAGVISDVKLSGANHLRFNLNGGDSLAYWVSLDNPEVIGNFKGEPYMMTKSVDEAFYKSLIKATKHIPSNQVLPDGMEILAFYATNRASTLYIGSYDRAKDVLRVDKSGESAGVSWLLQHGAPYNGRFPHYDLVHDISSDIRYEEGYPVINLYERTDLIKQYGGVPRTFDLDTTMALLDERCPVIMKFLRSATGDPRSAKGFINWLAFIFQYRIKTGTAWLLWGTEGTGKGKLLEHVIRPLFGQNSVSQVMMSNVDKQFNVLLEGKLIVNVDEAEMSRTRDKEESMAKLRNWITEPMIVINEKQVSEREIASYVNFIITANSYRPLRINAGDRRFHVASRQEERLLPTANEYATLVQGDELPMFAQCLGQLVVDEDWVRQPELNEHKLRLFESTHSLLDNVAMAINEGDASFFFEARPPDTVLNTYSGSSLLSIRLYDDLLRAMHEKKLNVLRQEDLYVLFSTVVNDAKFFPDNQTMQRQIYNRYGLLPQANEMHMCRRTGRKQHGVEAPKWGDVPEYLLEVIHAEPADPAKVVPIRK